MLKKILQILIIFLLINFLVATTRQIFKFYDAKSNLEKSVEKLENLKTQNQKLREELEFRQTQEFVEEAARNQLGLVKEGETVIILPKTGEEGIKEETKLNGIKFWLDRLFGS